MAQMSQAGDLTSGPMLKKIILFSLPLAASSFLQLLFNAADVPAAPRWQQLVPTVHSSTCWSTCLSALRWVQTLWRPAVMVQRMTRACTKRCRLLLP